jgi:ABC-type phosphate transport system substrate-binding protein
VPIFSNALAIVYKLPAGILPLNTRIKMSASLLAGMYQGTITNWNHSDIVAINPFLANVDIPIEAVGRGDACGVSYSFTEFLTRGAPSSGWNVISDRPAWESPVKSTAGNQGMADFVSRTPGAIGYVTYGLALSSGFDFVDLLNKDGHYVAPSHDSVNAAVEKYLEEAGNPPPGDAHWGEESLVFLGGEETYPLSMFLYFITLQSQVIPKYNGAASSWFSMFGSSITWLDN